MLLISPENPIIENTGEPGVATVTVDLSPEAKKSLSGSGKVPVSLSVPEWTTELIGPEEISIPYENGSTVPVTVSFRKVPWLPNPANEFNDKLCWLAAESRGSRVVAQAISRGSYYPVVKDYLTKAQSLSWVPPYLGQDGRYLADLVRYLVPASALATWGGIASEPTTIAAAYQLGYTPQDLSARGTNAICTPYGLYTLEAFGWKSQAEVLALEKSYILSVRPKNENFGFSLRNRVPVSYFLQALRTLPAKMDSGEKDFRIASQFHKQRAAEQLKSIKYPAAAVMAQLQKTYGLTDYCSVAPHASEAAARTWVDRSWRRNAPLALVVFDRENLVEGTFGEADIIGHLAHTHRLVIGQAKDAAEFSRIASSAFQRNGPFDVVVLAGHGNFVSAACLKIEDKPAFTALGTMLRPQATVLLASCSGAYFSPDAIDSRIRNGQTAAVHIAAAMQDAMPDARVVAADDIIGKALLRYVPGAASPAGRYRIFFQGAGPVGAVAGKTASGIPRDWLSREFAIPDLSASGGAPPRWNALAQQDSDGDGQSNAMEYFAGTNPRSAKDFLAATTSRTTGGEVQIDWNGSCRNEQCLPFRILASADPAKGPWKEVASGISRSVTGENTYTTAAPPPGTVHRILVP